MMFYCLDAPLINLNFALLYIIIMISLTLQSIYYLLNHNHIFHHRFSCYQMLRILCYWIHWACLQCWAKLACGSWAFWQEDVIKTNCRLCTWGWIGVSTTSRVWCPVDILPWCQIDMNLEKGFYDWTIWYAEMVPEILTKVLKNDGKNLKECAITSFQKRDSTYLFFQNLL